MVATNNGQGQQNRIDIHPQRRDDDEDKMLARMGKYAVVGALMFFAVVGIVVVVAITAKVVLGLLD